WREIWASSFAAATASIPLRGLICFPRRITSKPWRSSRPTKALDFPSRRLRLSGMAQDDHNSGSRPRRTLPPGLWNTDKKKGGPNEPGSPPPGGLKGWALPLMLLFAFVLYNVLSQSAAGGEPVPYSEFYQA